jgi:hypothetical protein
MTLNEIHNRFPNWIHKTKNNKLIRVCNSSGFPLGCIYQDGTRYIYEFCIFEGGVYFVECAEFLTNFKHRRLLTLKTGLYMQYIGVLKEIWNETIQDTE